MDKYKVDVVITVIENSYYIDIRNIKKRRFEIIESKEGVINLDEELSDVLISEIYEIEKRYKINGITIFIQNKDVIIKDMSYSRKMKDDELENMIELEIRQIKKIDITNYVIKKKIIKKEEGDIVRCGLIPRTIFDLYEDVQMNTNSRIKNMFLVSSLLDNLCNDICTSNLYNIVEEVDKTCEYECVSKNEEENSGYKRVSKNEEENSGYECVSKNEEENSGYKRVSKNEEENSEYECVSNIVIEGNEVTCVFMMDEFGVRDFIVVENIDLDDDMLCFLKDNHTKSIKILDLINLFNRYDFRKKNRLLKDNLINLSQKNINTNKIMKLALFFVAIIFSASLYLKIENNILLENCIQNASKKSVVKTTKVYKVPSFKKLYGICIDKIIDVFDTPKMYIEYLETDKRNVLADVIVLDKSDIDGIIDILKRKNVGVKSIEVVERNVSQLNYLKNINSQKTGVLNFFKTYAEYDVENDEDVVKDEDIYAKDMYTEDIRIIEEPSQKKSVKKNDNKVYESKKTNNEPSKTTITSNTQDKKELTDKDENKNTNNSIKKVYKFKIEFSI